MPKEPIHKKVDGHFYACSSCEYEGGFHVTFRNTEQPRELEIILMCPNCEQTYDVNWKIETD